MYLTCTRDGSNKFWEAKVEGSKLVVRWGRIGTDGQTKTEPFPSRARAETELAKRVKEKLNKGYTEGKQATVSGPPAARSSDLKQILRQLDPLLGQKSNVRLKAGCNDAALDKLNRTFFGGAGVPPDVETWFRWHDGQRDVDSLSPEDNRTLLSIQQALQAWSFLSAPNADIMRPWEPSWLPLLENGAGDYLVLEAKGKRAGALIGYWHDDRRRDVEYKNLTTWAKELKGALGNLEVTPTKERMRIELAKPAWKPVEKAAAPEKKPVGTLFYYKRLYFEQPAPWCIVWVKVAPDVWLTAMAKPGPGEAIAELQETMARKRLPADWEWRKSDSEIVHELSARNVRADGKMKHVGLFTGNVTVHGTVVPHRDGV